MQKITTSTILTVLLTLLFACKKDMPLDRTANGVVVSRSYNWKTPQYSGGPSMTGSYFMSPIYYNGNIAVPTIGEGKQYMTLLDSDNGNILWKWSDLFQPDTEQIDIYYYYQQGNLLTYQKGNRSYCINMDTGATQWKFRRDNYFLVSFSGLNNDYFSFGSSPAYPNLDVKTLYKGDVQTGSQEEFLVPNFTGIHTMGDRMADVTKAIPYMLNGAQHLVITWQELTSSDYWFFQTNLALYNLETNQWIYEKKEMNEPNINGVVLAPLKFYDGKVYANVGKELVCHDIATGAQLWSRSFAQDFMFSGFVIAEGKIVANCEDGYTYGIDPDTGAILWQTRSSGTSGRMSYLNGVVYFVGGASGKLHAIDVASGRMLWAIEAPNLGEDSGNNFKTNAVYVFEAANGNPARVIALSHLYAYSFDAER